MDPRATPIVLATSVPIDGVYAIMVDGQELTTPVGNPVRPDGEALADAMLAELLDDEIADVTRPSLYAFYSAEHDFIRPDPERTIDALVELLAHDYVVHPDERLARRQVQLGAWAAQLELWRRIAGRQPPYAPPNGEPEISRAAYGAFHAHLHGLTPAQLSVAIHGANLLKSVTLGILLAEQAIDERDAVEAMSAIPRVLAGDSQQDMQEEDEREEWWLETIRRLSAYARLAAAGSSPG